MWASERERETKIWAIKLPREWKWHVKIQYFCVTEDNIDAHAYKIAWGARTPHHCLIVLNPFKIFTKLLEQIPNTARATSFYYICTSAISTCMLCVALAPTEQRIIVKYDTHTSSIFALARTRWPTYYKPHSNDFRLKNIVCLSIWRCQMLVRAPLFLTLIRWQTFVWHFIQMYRILSVLRWSENMLANWIPANKYTLTPHFIPHPTIWFKIICTY